MEQASDSKSTTMQIRWADGEQEACAWIGNGEALLIGRRPEPARLNWEALWAQFSLLGNGFSPPAQPPRVHTLVVTSSRASANHALVFAHGDVALILDLESRNGSWLRLGSGLPCALPLAGEVQLVMSGPGLSLSSRSLPPDAAWSSRTDFGHAVKQTLVRWLASTDPAFEVSLHPAGTVVPEGIPLADGQILQLIATGTLRVEAAELQNIIRRYLYDQNARYFQLERRVAGMVVESASMRSRLLRTAEAAAAGRRTVVLGPTGVGKELLARSYHGYSARHAGPFVSVNCALLDKQLLYAQLFGARRGSFTGAVTDVQGLVESADGGTLFFDELGEMSMEVQAALLRFLDTHGEYCRLGDTQARRVSVQVVCATNQPLDDPSYRSGHFRDDLWYRLASAVIWVPPLRERREDILAYLHHRTLPGSPHSVATCLSKAAIDCVLADEWPGNFRDLENFVHRLPSVTEPGAIDAELCRQHLQEGRVGRGVNPTNRTGPRLVEEARLPGKDSPRGEPRPTRSRGEPGSSPAPGWEHIVGQALSAFVVDQGDEPQGWAQLQRFIEWYLKPSYVGHCAGSQELEASGPSVNYSAIARALQIADGKTVKTHLVRFDERFAKAEGSTRDADPPGSPPTPSRPPN